MDVVYLAGLPVHGLSLGLLPMMVFNLQNCLHELCSRFFKVKRSRVNKERINKRPQTLESRCYTRTWWLTTCYIVQTRWRYWCSTTQSNHHMRSITNNLTGVTRKTIHSHQTTNFIDASQTSLSATTKMNSRTLLVCWLFFHVLQLLFVVDKYHTGASGVSPRNDLPSRALSS